MIRRAVLVALATALLCGCSASGLSFRQDDRISIVSPDDNERVSLPLQISWSSDGYAGYYAVFIDGTPMRPSRGLLSLVPETDPCRERIVCPDTKWLAERRIYVTKSTSLTVESLPDRRGSKRGADRHQLTIVLLDEDGTRNGEAAFVQEFIVERTS